MAIFRTVSAIYLKDGTSRLYMLLGYGTIQNEKTLHSGRISLNKTNRKTILNYRLEYWKRFRALGWPGFFRSTIRGSRVKSPSLRIAIRIVFSSLENARATPCEMAPACPLTPPPKTSTQISYCFPSLDTSKGRITIHLERACPPKYSSRFLSLITNFPSPGRRRTRAVAFFRRPVAHTGNAILAVAIISKRANRLAAAARSEDERHLGTLSNGSAWWHAVCFW